MISKLFQVWNRPNITFIPKKVLRNLKFNRILRFGFCKINMFKFVINGQNYRDIGRSKAHLKSSFSY